jgi:hypothetical protein
MIPVTSEGPRELDPYMLGQLDAQRRNPRPPLYDDKADADAYTAGWRTAAPSRPVPNVLRTPPPAPTLGARLRRLFGRAEPVLTWYVQFDERGQIYTYGRTEEQFRLMMQERYMIRGDFPYRVQVVRNGRIVDVHLDAQ